MDTCKICNENLADGGRAVAVGGKTVTGLCPKCAGSIEAMLSADISDSVKSGIADILRWSVSKSALEADEKELLEAELQGVKTEVERNAAAMEEMSKPPKKQAAKLLPGSERWARRVEKLSVLAVIISTVIGLLVGYLMAIVAASGFAGAVFLILLGTVLGLGAGFLAFSVLRMLAEAGINLAESARRDGKNTDEE